MCRCVLWEEGMASIYSGEGRGHPYRWKQPPTVIQACNRPSGVGNILLHHPLAKTGRKLPWKALNRSNTRARCAVVNCWEENRTSGHQNQPNRRPNHAWAATAFSRATHRLPHIPAVGRAGQAARPSTLPACALALPAGPAWPERRAAPPTHIRAWC